MKKINIFLDDCRITPNGYVRTYTVEETIELLEKHKGEIGIVSLDNDLGEGLKEGYVVAEWLEEQYYLNNYPLPDNIIAHTMNIIAKHRMELIIDKLYRGK